MTDMEVENIRDELEKINPVELFTSNEVLDAIQIYDSTM